MHARLNRIPALGQTTTRKAATNRLYYLIGFFALGLVCSNVRLAAAGATPSISSSAEDLARRINLDDTDYRHGKWDVDWGAQPHCFTDCSGFLDAVLIHTYNWHRSDLEHWLHVSRPNAANYYDAIRGNNGFTPVARVQEIAPGDVLAVKYLHRTDNSGHIMIADGAAEAMTARPPVIAGTQQWQLAIIDCSESGHGPEDTRHKRGADGKDHAGLGRGILRLYTRVDGQPVGFSWSALKVSGFKGSDSEPIAIGRFVKAE